MGDRWIDRQPGTYMSMSLLSAFTIPDAKCRCTNCLFVFLLISQQSVSQFYPFISKLVITRIKLITIKIVWKIRKTIIRNKLTLCFSLESTTNHVPILVYGCFLFSVQTLKSFSPTPVLEASIYSPLISDLFSSFPHLLLRLLKYFSRKALCPW